MAARIGVFLRDRRLTVVALRGRRRLEHFLVEEAEDVARTLAAELRARRLARGRLHLGLDRRHALVKTIELPRVKGADLARVIAFDLERHVPFSPDAAACDWVQLPGGPTGPRRVLLVAAEARAVEAPRALLAAAQRRPAALTVACHGLTALLPRARPARFAVWVHRHHGVADLLLLDGRTLLASRQVTTADAVSLAHEVRRSLTLARRSVLEEVWLSGDDAVTGRAELSAALVAPVSAPPLAATARPLVAALPAHDRGAGLLALAVAFGPRSPILNLLPAAARPWTPSRAQLATAALLVATVLLGLGLALARVTATERYLGRLTAEVRRLEPDVKAVERLAGELAARRRVLTALGAVEAGRVQALPVLRELTEVLPAGAWLQALIMDRQGVEITGQADGAGALIPLLEASSRLERVELTSPVTRSQGKEQFRIRAAWEAPRRSPSGH